MASSPSRQCFAKRHSYCVRQEMLDGMGPTCSLQSVKALDSTKGGRSTSKVFITCSSPCKRKNAWKIAALPRSLLTPSNPTYHPHSTTHRCPNSCNLSPPRSLSAALSHNQRKSCDLRHLDPIILSCLILEDLPPCLLPQQPPSKRTEKDLPFHATSIKSTSLPCPSTSNGISSGLSESLACLSNRAP